MRLLPDREREALAARRAALVADLDRTSRRLVHQTLRAGREHPAAAAGVIAGVAAGPWLAARLLGPVARPLRATGRVVWPVLRAAGISALVR